MAHFTVCPPYCGPEMLQKLPELVEHFFVKRDSAGYVPSLAGNATYLSLFSLLMLAQLGFWFWYSTHSFSILMMGVCILEIGGYLGRMVLHYHPTDWRAFYVSYFLIVLAPFFLNAAIYIVVSRILFVRDTFKVYRFSANKFFTLFSIWNDVACLLVMVGSLVAIFSTLSTIEYEWGNSIALAGMVLHLFQLMFFIYTWIDFAFRTVQVHYLGHRPGSRPSEELYATSQFYMLPQLIHAACIFLFVRALYRIVQFWRGDNLMGNQVAFMIFEGPMVLCAVTVLTVHHPGFAFGGKQGWKDSRFERHSERR